jgi:hypothetical protein
MIVSLKSDESDAVMYSEDENQTGLILKDKDNRDEKMGEKKGVHLD